MDPPNPYNAQAAQNYQYSTNSYQYPENTSIVYPTIMPQPSSTSTTISQNPFTTQRMQNVAQEQSNIATVNTNPFRSQPSYNPPPQLPPQTLISLAPAHNIKSAHWNPFEVQPSPPTSLPQRTTSNISFAPPNYEFLDPKEREQNRTNQIPPRQPSPEVPRVPANKESPPDPRSVNPSAHSRMVITQGTQPSKATVSFPDIFSIYKPRSSTLTVCPSFRDGKKFIDAEAQLLFYRRKEQTDAASHIRRFTLYAGEDSTNEVVGTSTARIADRGRERKINLIVNGYGTVHEFVVQDYPLLRLFPTSLPGVTGRVTFYWKGSAGREVLDLNGCGLMRGMKLVRDDTGEVCMVWVRSSLCGRNTRQGKHRGRAAFVGRRLGAPFEAMAVLSLLVLLDSHWEL